MTQSTPQLSPEKFPIGQRVSLPGHFPESVTLEGIRFIGSGYECRVRLADGTSDEAILTLEEGATLAGTLSEGSPSIESVVATVRNLWTAVEGANEGETAKLKQDITQT